jgi:cell division protein FtsI/penicillin-binding protein 2
VKPRLRLLIAALVLVPGLLLLTPLKADEPALRLAGSPPVVDRDTPDVRRELPLAAIRTTSEGKARADRPKAAPDAAKPDAAPRLGLADVAKAAVDRASGRLVIAKDDSQIQLTLDATLQREVASFLKQANPARAAFVALDPRTGRVLALVEHARGKAGAHPLVDASPPAASIQKILTSLALFQKKPDYDAAANVCYHGGHSSLSKGHILDSPKLDKRCVDLGAAFARSVNQVFGKLFYRHLERRDLEAVGQALGFGDDKLPFPLDYQPGRLTLGNDRIAQARQAAGFWGSRLSPVHGALLGAVLATDGLLHVPYLVEAVTREGTTVYAAPEAETKRVLDAEVVRAVDKLMARTDDVGTARRYVQGSKLLKKLGVPCKSGTLSGYPGDKLSYTWFVGYAPEENPTIAFAAMVGNDGKWRIKAGNLMRKALETAFADRKQAAMDEAPEAPTVARAE